MPEANYDDVDNIINSGITIIIANIYWGLVKSQAQF